MFTQSDITISIAISSQYFVLLDQAKGGKITSLHVNSAKNFSLFQLWVIHMQNEAPTSCHKTLKIFTGAVFTNKTAFILKAY